MAIKALMMRKRIDGVKAELEAARENSAKLESREAELARAIEEAETDEEISAVEEEVDDFAAEKEAVEEEIATLQAKIEELEAELAKMEEDEPESAEETAPAEERSKGDYRTMQKQQVEIRSLPKNIRALDALDMGTRTQIENNAEVKEFAQRMREMKGNTRALSGAELNIPVVLLDIVAENMYRYSKLMNCVRVRNVAGESRQTIVGTVPEAVWTEMCASINEMSFTFNQVTLDGYKVAGFIPVCNSVLEDTSDIDLAAAIVEMISEAIGLAKDKAILYGKGSASKMPLGIVTRLAQTTKPSDYPANAPAWVDLSTSNVISVDNTLTGAEFWAALTEAAANTFTEYARGDMFWAMNSKTYAMLKAKVITFTATGDVVANVLDVLPVVTGNIQILEFMPDGDIVGGYGDLYLWAQRAGMTIEQSREVQFLQDNTVFKGKERADGMPIIADAFVAMNINGGTVTTAMTFAEDTANVTTA